MWAARQRRAKRFERFSRSNAVNFHAPIAQILGIAADAKLPRHALREVTIPHALHHSGNKKELRLELLSQSVRGTSAANARFYQTWSAPAGVDCGILQA